MINRVYEVTCDKCGGLIMRSNALRPPLKKLRNLCTVQVRNGKTLTYCKYCFDK